MPPRPQLAVSRSARSPTSPATATCPFCVTTSAPRPHSTTSGRCCKPGGDADYARCCVTPRSRGRGCRFDGRAGVSRAAGAQMPRSGRLMSQLGGDQGRSGRVGCVQEAQVRGGRQPATPRVRSKPDPAVRPTAVSSCSRATGRGCGLLLKCLAASGRLQPGHVRLGCSVYRESTASLLATQEIREASP